MDISGISNIGMLLKKAVDIIEYAIAEHKPSSVFIAYSGGRDSAVVLDIAARMQIADGIMAIDTGLSADSWTTLINIHAQKYGIPLEFARGGHRDWYGKNVREYGFGYTRGHHTVYYRMLKQDAIRAHVRTHKTSHYDRVMYLTGVRRSESPQRAKTPASIRDGSRVSVNPLIHWRSESVAAYLKVMVPDYYNPFYERYGNSGDCYCGWTCQHAAHNFRDHSPDLAAYLEALSAEQSESGLHTYGERPKKDALTIDMFEDMPADSFCVNCTSVKNESNESEKL